MKQPQSLKTVLHAQGAELGTILRHAEYLGRVRKVVAEVLPAAAAHIHVADVSSHKLIVHTDSTGWATRLRYAETDIRRFLAQRLRLHVARVVIRVRPDLAQAPRQPVQRRISTANGDYIRRIARHIGHSELAGALLTLAAHDQDARHESRNQAATTGRALT